MLVTLASINEHDVFRAGMDARRRDFRVTKAISGFGVLD